MNAISDSARPRAVDDAGEPVQLGQFNGFEIYPMPMFATFSVADVAATTNWYVRALGFGVVFQGPAVGGQPAMVHLRRGKYQDLMLVPVRGDMSVQAAPSQTLSFQTEDVDNLAAQVRAVPATGSSKLEGPVDTPWNTRDLRVTDPAGHRLVFTGRSPNADPEQLERMRSMLDAGRIQK